MDQKISVIIPTVQKTMPILNQLVELLTEDPAVSEILVINNKPDVSITKKFNPKKVEVIIPSQNMYVNPSWNLGINIIKNDKFAIINDDLLICRNFCSQVLETGILDDKTTGLLGAGLSFIKMKSPQEMQKEPDFDEKIALEFEPLTLILGTGDWGICIMGRKDSYYQIPDDLKIIYGDNYLLDRNLKAGKTNYSILNRDFFHVHSASCASQEFSSVVASDIGNSKRYFKN